MSTAYVYSCVVVEWIDGDTVVLDIDLGFRLTRRDAVRLFGVNTPEMRSKDPAEREKAAAAKAFVEGLAPPGTRLLAHSHKPHRQEDKFGRWLADVILQDGRSVSSALLEAGHAKRYLVNGVKP